MIQKYFRIIGIICCFLFFAMIVFVLLRRPNDDRFWEIGQERLSYITIDGDRMAIENFRDFLWHEKENVGKFYQTKIFDLKKIEGVDVVISHFDDFEGLAHIFLTFRFADGNNVVISVETRREDGETFSPLAGIFRQFEIIYVVGSERDLIGMRTHTREERVYIYPTIATPQQARMLLMSLADGVNMIHNKPVFYNTIFNNCINAVTNRVENIFNVQFPFSYRMFLPGYVDEVLYEKKLIPHDAPFQEIKKRYRVDKKSFELFDPNFSEKIRLYDKK